MFHKYKRNVGYTIPMSKIKSISATTTTPTEGVTHEPRDVEITGICFDIEGQVTQVGFFASCLLVNADQVEDFLDIVKTEDEINIYETPTIQNGVAHTTFHGGLELIVKAQESGVRAIVKTNPR